MYSGQDKINVLQLQSQYIIQLCRAHEKEKEEQNASNQQDVAQEVDWRSPAKIMQQAAATRGIPGSPHMGFQPEALEERQRGDALRHTLHSAKATAVATNPAAVTTEAAALATNAATGPAEATENGTNAATMPGNHGRSDSIVGFPLAGFSVSLLDKLQNSSSSFKRCSVKVRW